MSESRPIRPTDVKAGQTFDLGGIVIEIVEVIPTQDILGKKQYIIGYRIREKDFVSPVGHWFVSEDDDIKRWIKETVEFYIRVRDMLRRG